MTVDPEDLGNETAEYLLHVPECSSIPSKLQKRAVGPTSPTSQLVEVDFRVFNNRDIAEEKKEEGKMKKQPAFLAVALRLWVIWAPEEEDHFG